MDHTQHREVVKDPIIVSFDQAAARGIPASAIVKGLMQKFSLRHAKIVTRLEDAKRICVRQIGDAQIVWQKNPPLMVNTNVTQQSEQNLAQAVVDFGLSQGVVIPEDLDDWSTQSLLAGALSAITATPARRVPASATYHSAAC